MIYRVSARTEGGDWIDGGYRFSDRDRAEAHARHVERLIANYTTLTATARIDGEPGDLLARRP